MTNQSVRRLVERTCADQGVPVWVEDVPTLARVAALLATTPSNDSPGRRPVRVGPGRVVVLADDRTPSMHHKSR